MSNPASDRNEAAERLREWAMDVVRSVPSVPIRDTEAVPTFKRRVTACIDRAAVLLALRHADPPATERAIGAGIDVPIAAVRSSCAWVEENIAPKRCDNEGVRDCWRCNTVFLARTLARLTPQPGEPTDE